MKISIPSKTPEAEEGGFFSSGKKWIPIALANIKSGTIRIDGFYPGFEGRYTYPLQVTED